MGRIIDNELTILEINVWENKAQDFSEYEAVYNKKNEHIKMTEFRLKE